MRVVCTRLIVKKYMSSTKQFFLHYKNDVIKIRKKVVVAVSSAVVVIELLVVLRIYCVPINHYCS